MSSDSEESERAILRHVDEMADEEIAEKLAQYRQLDRDFSTATGMDRLGDDNIPTVDEMKQDGMAFIGTVPFVCSMEGDNDG